jgi:hypothetical protein
MIKQFLLLGMLFMMVLLTACSMNKLPTTEPYIFGEIKNLTETGMLIDDHIDVNIEKAIIFNENEDKIEFNQLKVGDRVAVWICCDVVESYPLQGTADYVQRR